MPKRQLSGHQKRIKKQKTEALINSQKGAIKKFFSSNENVQSSVEEYENLVIDVAENLVNEEQVEEECEDLGGEKAYQCVNESSNESSRDINQNEALNIECAPVNIDDPCNWDNMDQKLRDLLVERGPVRRNGDATFPKDDNEKSRHFSSVHYIRHLPNGEKHDRKWLVYSEALNKVFCFCCKLFKNEGNKTQLANDGFQDWKNIGDRLKSHETNWEHLTCMNKWIELERRFQKNQTIDKSVQERVIKEREHWRGVLLREIALVEALAQNNLPFRGENEKIYQRNNGNFLCFIQMMGKFDLVMQEHLRRIEKGEIHNHYLSHKIQNELIQMLAAEVKSKIVTTIKAAKYYSVILDCTPDVSHEEQMSLVVRCVDISTSPIEVRVSEFFLEFLKVDDTTGLGLFCALQEVLVSLQLDIGDLRGQGYDNGSNMKGKNKGVQTRVLEVNPRAFYTPCGCHSLNLVLCDMANSCSKAKTFFGVVQRLYMLFSSSIQRWAILKDNLKDVKGLTLKTLSQTRWESRIESIKPIRYHPSKLRDALVDLANDPTTDSMAQSEAKSLAKNELENFEFLFAMAIWYKLLFAVNIVSKFLQSEDMCIDLVIEKLKGLIDYFENYRKVGFAEAMVDATEMANEMGIEPKFVEKRIIQRKKQFDEDVTDEVTHSAEESMRVNYFLVIVDKALSSFKDRFQQFEVYEKNFGFLFDLEKASSSDECLKNHCTNLEEVLKHGGVSDTVGRDLFVELKCLKQVLPRGAQKPIEVLNYIKLMADSFPNAWNAYRVLLTISVSVASGERSFSKLKLIKNYLRSTMSQERLNGLAMLSIENDLVKEVDYTNLIDSFASRNARRVIFK
ncbi:hypothetical protein RHMOL_Rhmol12G0052200 [Rhododendron molle]|uniref:Uncharacterized protein n=1 Tax=Rhododendron molle TaxID=49168 RepID=A0ACC0LET0_RHOML|nr:hypothetical protein RHMOL_Rhmol12G0052200 [Rhododendron molle]